MQVKKISSCLFVSYDIQTLLYIIWVIIYIYSIDILFYLYIYIYRWKRTCSCEAGLGFVHVDCSEAIKAGLGIMGAEGLLPVVWHRTMAVWWTLGFGISVSHSFCIYIELYIYICKNIYLYVYIFIYIYTFFGLGSVLQAWFRVGGRPVLHVS